MKNYYSILGINKTANPAEIKIAYRKLVVKWHPDKVSIDLKKEAHDKFVAIQEAYEILADENKRKEYDWLYAVNFEHRQTYDESTYHKYEEDVKSYGEQAQQSGEKYAGYSFEEFTDAIFEVLGVVIMVIAKGAERIRANYRRVDRVEKMILKILYESKELMTPREIYRHMQSSGYAEAENVVEILGIMDGLQWGGMIKIVTKSHDKYRNKYKYIKGLDRTR